MTTFNMKSELLMESRLRAESRQPLQRRRIAKTASACAVLENGECDPDLNLAIQESLKLARQNELKQQANAALNTANFDEDEENEPVATQASATKGKVESKQPDSKKTASVNRKNESENSSSSQLQVEGLLMLHLDLIQHQQELLTTKDKEIIHLRDDKEALKCRLERMERRMAILKQKEEVVGAVQHTRTSATEPPYTGHGAERIHKRKLLGESPSASKKLPSEPIKFQRRFSTASKVGKPQCRESDQLYNPAARGSRRKGQGSKQEDPETLARLERQRFLQKREKIHNEHSIVRTEDLSGIAQHIPLFEDDDEAIHERLRADKEGKRQSEVEIPTWRYRTVPNCYTLEGTENLEDEVFIKRHQKPEYEEKRRKRCGYPTEPLLAHHKKALEQERDALNASNAGANNERIPLILPYSNYARQVYSSVVKNRPILQARWDLQRLREQRMYEHLKEKEKIPEFVGTYRPKDNDTVSFLPSVEDITHVEVCDRIPVSAFGCPIPFVAPSEFELPWDHQVKKPRHTEKQTPKPNRCYTRRK